MKKRYDTIVIGSGCGGAAAAALSSRLGMRTLLLEKTPYIGGKASTYEKEGFKLDHGHIIMRCNKGPHGDVLRIARCVDLMPKFSISTFWPTTFSVGGTPVNFVPNFWSQMLTPGFLRQLSAFGLTPREKFQLAAFCLSVIFMPKSMIRSLDYVDIHTFLSRFTSSEFSHAAFGGLAIVGFGALNMESSAGELIRVMQYGVKDIFNIGYPVTGEGISAIPKAFLKAAARLGCDMRTRLPADRILVENGKVKGVLINGETIYATCVISNAGIKETMHHLAEDGTQDKADKAEKVKGAIEITRQELPPSKSPVWDVIVIGTGMGGSAAGAVCASHGLKTLILEKNPRPGGACSYYDKQGFRMDTGTHLFIRGNKGPFGKLTQRLAMGRPIQFYQTRQTVHLKGVNVDAVVPKSIRGRIAVAPLILWQAKIHPIHYPAIMRLLIDIAFMSLKEIEALDNTTIEEFMFRYTDNTEIRTMIGMLLGLFFILPPWEASAGESIWNLQKLIWEDNLSYPKGGASVIPMTFLQGAKNHGAEIRLNSGVKKIEVKDNRVSGILTDQGEYLAARAVISTTSVYDTVFHLTGKDHFPGLYIEKTKGIKPSWTAVQAKIAVKKKLIRAGSLVGGIPLKYTGAFTDEFVRASFNNLEKGIQGDTIPIYAPVPTNFDPGLAPKGRQIITAVAVAPTLDAPLKDSWDIWIQGMMRALYQMVPGLKKNIIFCDTWSVKTLAAWIGKSNGSAITTSQSADQVRINRPSHHTPVNGLYLAGDCAGIARGVGTELACQSGMDCGDLVTQDIKGCAI